MPDMQHRCPRHEPAFANVQCQICGAMPDEPCPFDDITPGLTVLSAAITSTQPVNAAACDPSAGVCEACQ